MSAPRIVGGAVEGGTSLSGITLASDVSGGGLVAVDYSEIQLGINSTRDHILYFNRLMIALQGGIRNIVVPMMTDIYAPVPDNFFPNDAGATPTVTGTFLSNKPVGSSTVDLTVVNGRLLQGGEWFGVFHPTKQWRVYCVTDIVTQTTVAGVINATVNIRPPLRDVAISGNTVDWWRPQCLMRVKSGSDITMMLDGYWRGMQNLSFIEAF